MRVFFSVFHVSNLICISLLFSLASAGCSSKKDVAQQPVKNTIVSESKEHAVIAENEGPSIDATSSAGSNTNDKQQPALFFIEFNEFGKSAAYIAKVGEQYRVVHNGKPGKLYQSIHTNTVRISPDGQRLVYAAKVDNKTVVVLDGKEVGPFDEIAPPVFSPDSRHVAYEGKRGDKWHIFVDGLKSAPAVSYFDKPVFNSDSTKIMFIENTDTDLKKRVVISDLTFKVLGSIPSVAQPFAISDDKRRLAFVTDYQGKQRVSEINFEEPGTVKNGPAYDSVSKLVLNSDGSSLAYVAKKGTESYLVLNGKEERLPSGETPWPPVIRPGTRGAGIVIVGKDGASLHQAFYNDGIKSRRYKETAELTYSNDGKNQAFGAIKNEKFLVVVNGVEGPLYDRVIGPRFSPDGEFMVYRARKDNIRFIVVADSKGKTLRQHAGYERVFEPVFTADGKSVAYGVKDGKKLLWKVERL